MTSFKKSALAATVVSVLAGCGGNSSSPLLGTGPNPQVRAINLTIQTTNVTYGSASNSLGTLTQTQNSIYATEAPGLNRVSFNVNGSPITSVNRLFQKGAAYTVVGVTSGGTYQTFCLTDGSLALNSQTAGLRVANTSSDWSGAPVDVYLQPGLSANPSLTAQYRIAQNLPFGAACAYTSAAQGTYTLSIVVSGTSTVECGTELTLIPDEDATVYVGQEGFTYVLLDGNS